MADGNVVYVPQVCGNLSLLRNGAVAHRPAPHHAVVAAAKTRKKSVAYTPAIGHVAADAPAAETPVSLAPPADVAAAAPATIAQAGPIAAAAAAHAPSGFLFAIPAAIGGIIAGVTQHHDTPAAPPCNEGSNLQNACQGSTNSSKH